MTKDKYSDDKISLSAYANESILKHDRIFEALGVEIRDLAQSTFRDPADATQRILDATDKGAAAGYAPSNLVDALRFAPQKLGALRGGDFAQTDERERARENASKIGVLIQARADAKVIVDRYRDLHNKVSAAERAPEETRFAAMEAARYERAYADATRDARTVEHRDRLARWEEANPREPAPERKDIEEAGASRWWRPAGKQAQEAAKDISEPQKAVDRTPEDQEDRKWRERWFAMTPAERANEQAKGLERDREDR